MALKHQKPACVWEWYISQEIHHRLNDKEKVNNFHFQFCFFISGFLIEDIFQEQFFVHYSKVYIFKNASLMLSDWAPCGTILSLVSSIKNPTNSTVRITTIEKENIFVIDILMRVYHLYLGSLSDGCLRSFEYAADHRYSLLTFVPNNTRRCETG